MSDRYAAERPKAERPKAEKPAEGWSVEDYSDDDEPGTRWHISGPGVWSEDGYEDYHTPEYRTKAAAVRATHLWAAYIPANEALREYNREWDADPEEE